VNFFLGETGTELLGLLHELVPAATTIGVVVGVGSNNSNAEAGVEELQTAARPLALQGQGLKVATAREVDDMFAALARQPVDALVVQGGPVTASFSNQIASQAVRLSPATISCNYAPPFGPAPLGPKTLSRP
jgi:hypothetical protein